MGWASGSEIAESVWKLVRSHVDEKKRKNVAQRIIELFEAYDCDTIQEAEKLCKDAGREYDEDQDEIVYR